MEQNFNQREEKTIKFWKENKIFEKSVARAPKRKKEFVFYEGPPTANARPGIHHVETRVFKDMVCRYKTMAGFRVQRRAGWDTHGLPVELQIEKKLNLHNKKEIERYGIKEFNQECRDSVFEQIGEWQKLTDRIGYWLDMDNPYITYDAKYMESVWFILKRAWDKKILFQDYKVVPYCPRCGTALSSHEVAQGYQKVKEPSIYVKFRIMNPEIKNTSLVGLDNDSVDFAGQCGGGGQSGIGLCERLAPKSWRRGIRLILAKSRIGVLGEDYEIVEEIKGKDWSVCAIRRFFRLSDESEETIYKVIGADFVSCDRRYGHGAYRAGIRRRRYGGDQGAKQRIATQNDLPEFPVILNVGEDGAFILSVAKWAGMFVKDADPLIIKDLEERGIAVSRQPYEHDYPFCWRCKTPLLYYAKNKLVYQDDRSCAMNLIKKQSKDQLGAGTFERRAVWRMVARSQGLGGFPRPLLGHAFAGVEMRLRQCRSGRFARRSAGQKIFVRTVILFCATAIRRAK